MLRIFWTTSLALICLTGCGTINSYANGCPGAYSGVRQDLDLIASYRSGSGAEDGVPLGIDGPLGDAWDQVFAAFDVPLAAIADTLALPATYSMAPRAPVPPSLGCGWATASQDGEASERNPS